MSDKQLSSASFEANNDKRSLSLASKGKAWRAKLIDLQRNDPQIAKFQQGYITLEDVHYEQVCFYMNHGVL